MRTSLGILALALAAAPVAAETLTNTSVLSLVQAGVGDDAVIAKIKSSSNQFDLSTDQIIALKQKGVPSNVIAAMLAASGEGADFSKGALSADSPDWRVPHPSGVYMLNAGETKMLRIDPTTANQTKTGGMLAYALTAGIASIKMKSVIPNAHARVAAPNGKPTFYFYFDESNASLSNGAATGSWLSGTTASVTSPSEFSLVRFDVKSSRREARVGSFSMAGAKAGVMDKNRIAFAYDRVAPGIFRVTPSEELKPGEYGFLYSITAGSGPGIFGGGVMTARVFDFSIAA